MVEYNMTLDKAFGSLADPTRRDILRRLSSRELSVTAIAKPYPLSFAAISKHLMVLEKAKLVRKRRNGREQLVCLSIDTLQQVDSYLAFYRQQWENRFESLTAYLNNTMENAQ